MADSWLKFVEEEKKANRVFGLRKDQGDVLPYRTKILEQDSMSRALQTAESNNRSELFQFGNVGIGPHSDHLFDPNRVYETKKSNNASPNREYSKWDLLRPRHEPNLPSLNSLSSKNTLKSSNMAVKKKNYAVNVNSFNTTAKESITATAKESIYATDVGNINTIAHSTIASTYSLPKLSTVNTKLSPADANTISYTNKDTECLVDTSIESPADIITVYPVIKTTCSAAINLEDSSNNSNKYSNTVENAWLVDTSTICSADLSNTAYFTTTDNTWLVDTNTNRFTDSNVATVTKKGVSDNNEIEAIDECKNCPTDKGTPFPVDADFANTLNITQSTYWGEYLDRSKLFKDKTRYIRYTNWEMVSMRDEDESKHHTEGIMASMTICRLIIMGTFAPKSIFYVPKRQPISASDMGVKGFSEPMSTVAKSSILPCPMCQGKAA